MRNLLIFLLSISTLNILLGQNKITKILFIGNSLTYFNNMPETMQRMFEESGQYVKIYKITLPGTTLKQHLDILKGYNTTLEINDNLSIISFEEEKFDYIILQEATGSLLNNFKKEESIQAISEICEINQKYGCKILFYEPYPTYEYPKIHCFYVKKINDVNCSKEIKNSSEELNLFSKFSFDSGVQG